MGIETPTNYAGQWIQGGIINRTNQKAPLTGLESNPANTLNEKASLIQNAQLFGNLAGKILDVKVRETEIFASSLKNIFHIESASPFGIGYEMLYMTNLPGTSPETVGNHKNAETCFPGGVSNAVSTLYTENGATFISWMIYDHMIDGAVLNEGQMADIVSQMMKQYLVVENRKTINEYGIKIADVVPGKRTITSTTNSNGAGTAVSYAAYPAGYVSPGAVFAEDYVIQRPTEGYAVTMSVADELSFITKLRTLVRDMKGHESVSFNKLGIATFVGDKLKLAIPSKILDAMDENFLISTGNDTTTYKGIPTRSAREVIAEIMGGADRIIEIDRFEDLPDYDSTTYPTSTDYSDYNLVALLYTDGMFKKVIKEAGNIEVARCSGARAYSYTYLERYTLVTLLGESCACILAKKGSVAKFYNGDTLYETEYLNMGDTITAPTADPTSEEGTFSGWSTDGTTVISDLGTADYSGNTFYAVFE